MTKRQIIARLTALGDPDPVEKFHDIKSWLAYNDIPVKAVTGIRLYDGYGGPKDPKYDDHPYYITYQYSNWGEGEFNW